MILVDTSVWSLAFRRRRPADSPHVTHLQTSLGEGEVVLTGIVLQELLQGLRHDDTRDRLLAPLRRISLLVPERDDHVTAAEIFTTCRSGGVQLATVDALLAALCVRRGLTLLSTDRDFVHAAEHIELDIWQPEPSG